VPSAPKLNPGVNGVVFSMHVLVTQRPSPGTDYDLFRKGTSTTPGGMYKSELRSDGRASCRFRGSRHDLRIHAGPVISNGRWHTVSCWKLSTRIHLVVDGEVFTVPGAVGRIANSASIVLGAKPGGDWYAGRLDHVKITVLN
jgi:concanavalin A-like lectin/glucanase superfamily protein